VILIIAPAGDRHAESVHAQLRASNKRVARLDLADLPQNAALSLRIGEAECGGTVLACDGDRIDLASVDVVWWRRPRPPVLPATLADARARAFAAAEWHQALQGLWAATSARWINHPTHDDIGHSKPLQLCAARAVGLEIPETLISSNPRDVEDFVGTRCGVVYKTLTVSPDVWRETRRLGAAEHAALATVRYAPVIFQEEVQADVDVRVTVVGPSLFAAAIELPEEGYEIDYRMNRNARIVRPDLPHACELQIQDLMQRLGLIYGAIDMRRTADGRHIFLEVNPVGEWLFVEEATSQPMTAAMASLLARSTAVG
jgi:hypothetical protein